MGLSVAVVSSLYGGHDDPLPAPAGFDDAVLVTDRPYDVDGWRNVVLPQPGRHPRLAAKLAKFRPDLFTACEASVWIDASMNVLTDTMRADAEAHLADDDLVIWRHHENRDCIMQEARYCGDWPKYASYPIVAQAQHYLSQGMPENFGLWQVGHMARRHNFRTAELGLAWLGENEQWSIQDQISLPFLLWERKWAPAEWRAQFQSNPWVRVRPHNSTL